MSAQRLREAATKLRERANDPELTRQRVEVKALHLNHAKYLVISPETALALADWMGQFADDMRPDDWYNPALKPFVVADTILGPTS